MRRAVPFAYLRNGAFRFHRGQSPRSQTLWRSVPNPLPLGPKPSASWSQILCLSVPNPLLLGPKPSGVRSPTLCFLVPNPLLLGPKSVASRSQIRCLLVPNPLPLDHKFLMPRQQIILVVWKYISVPLKYISKPLKYISKPLKKFCSLPRRIWYPVKGIFLTCRGEFYPPFRASISAKIRIFADGKYQSRTQD